MSNIVVSGLINIETSCPINNFPIEYCPVHYPLGQIKSCISGVGFNLTTNLKVLNDNVTFISMIGDDIFGNLILSELKRKNFSTDNIYKKMNGTAQTVVLFDSTGKREIYSDFKDYQEVNFDFSVVEDTLKESDLIIACNSNFNRPLLRIAKGLNKPVATDVHVFYNIDDEYNKEFLENADILFMSDEALRDKDIRRFVWDIYTRYNNQIIVVGCGEKGALLFEAKTKEFTEIPSVYTRPVVSTSGAGDTLFSSFIHFYSKGIKPKESLRLACIAASYKIGEAGSSNGFWDETSILRFER